MQMKPFVRIRARDIANPAIDAVIGMVVFTCSAMLLLPTIAFLVASVGLAMIAQFFGRHAQR